MTLIAGGFCDGAKTGTVVVEGTAGVVCYD